jgi:hypothetical protein
MSATTTPSFAQTMLMKAAERALRNWLFELGRADAVIQANAGGLPDTYHLAEVRRVVVARAAVAPAVPDGAGAGEIRRLCELARQCGADAWEAYVVLRSNYHPSAILWRKVAA